MALFPLHVVAGHGLRHLICELDYLGSDHGVLLLQLHRSLAPLILIVLHVVVRPARILKIRLQLELDLLLRESMHLPLPSGHMFVVISVEDFALRLNHFCLR